MTKRAQYEQQLDDFETTVAGLEKRFEHSGNDRDQAIIEGAQTAVALRGLHDQARRSRMPEIADRANALKARLRTAMWEGNNV